MIRSRRRLWRPADGTNRFDCRIVASLLYCLIFIVSRQVLIAFVAEKSIFGQRFVFLVLQVNNLQFFGSKMSKFGGFGASGEQFSVFWVKYVKIWCFWWTIFSFWVKKCQNLLFFGASDVQFSVFRVEKMSKFWFEGQKVSKFCCFNSRKLLKFGFLVLQVKIDQFFGKKCLEISVWRSKCVRILVIRWKFAKFGFFQG